MKYNFAVYDKESKFYPNGIGEHDISCGSVGITKLWKNVKILTFEQFIDKDTNVETHDNGENFKDKGYASRYTINVGGIYDWYIKHKLT